jgi:hypothetical protein
MEMNSGLSERLTYHAPRNLLELHYWTRFVLVSTDNARRFFEDLICDYRELLTELAQLVATGKAFELRSGIFNELPFPCF